MKDIYSCCIFICATGADMANIHEAESSELISRVADKLKKEEIKKPAYIDYVKTGAGKERIPSSPDFWYIRCASILRQAYINGPIGVSKLRTRYGGQEETPGAQASPHKIRRQPDKRRV